MATRGPVWQQLRRVSAAVAVVLAIVGCSGELEPRRSAPVAVEPSGVVRFDSPRETIAIDLDPDVGVIEFRAQVRGATPLEVTAPGDGLIFDVVVASGDVVAAGDAVMSFLPAATRAEELELSIIELQRELGVEEGDLEAISRADAALDALRRAQSDRVVRLVAPESGLVTGVREGLERRINEGRSLFTISDPDSLRVQILATPARIENLAVDDPVVVRRTEIVGASPIAARIATIEPADPVVRVTIEIDDAARAAELELNEPVVVEIAPQTDDVANAVWIGNEVVRRDDGRSFVLLEQPSGELSRFDVVVVRRTDSHVLVADPLRQLTGPVMLVVP